ncbi:MAG: KH domain-containing protein [Deltaproteobacteria bacterium]|nr:KH domain-containing protein [Deltaproteobacteria bacterium]
MIRLAQYLAEGMSPHPEDILVEERPGPDDASEIVLSASAANLPFLIGRGGRNIRAIRALVSQAARARGRNAVLRLENLIIHEDPLFRDDPF